MKIEITGDLEERILLLARFRGKEAETQITELLESAVTAEEWYEVYKTTHPGEVI